MTSPTRPRGSAPRSPAGGTAKTGQRRLRTTARPAQGAAGPAGSRPSERVTPRGAAAGTANRASAATPGADRGERGFFSLRTVGIFLAVLVAFIVVAPNARAYVAQQEELRNLRAQLNASATRQDELRLQVELWRTNDYVRGQARERLGFILPGETAYRVVDPQVVTGEAPAPAPTPHTGPSAPWFVQIEESLVLAGTGEEAP